MTNAQQAYNETPSMFSRLGAVVARLFERKPKVYSVTQGHLVLDRMGRPTVVFPSSTAEEMGQVASCPVVAGDRLTFIYNEYSAERVVVTASMLHSPVSVKPGVPNLFVLGQTGARVIHEQAGLR